MVISEIVDDSGINLLGIKGPLPERDKSEILKEITRQLFIGGNLCIDEFGLFDFEELKILISEELDKLDILTEERPWYFPDCFTDPEEEDEDEWKIDAKHESCQQTKSAREMWPFLTLYHHQEFTNAYKRFVFHVYHTLSEIDSIGETEEHINNIFELLKIWTNLYKKADCYITDGVMR